MTEIEKIYKEYNVPKLKVGDICKVSDVWDGDTPEYEHAFWHNVFAGYTFFIVYEWEYFEKKENFLDSYVRITKIWLY